MTAATTAETRRSEVERLFNEVRKSLVETGTRNRLIHVNRANTKGNVINVVNGSADEVYSVLSSGRMMRFRSIGADIGDAGRDLVLYDRAASAIEPEEHNPWELETRLGREPLLNRVLKIHRAAKTAEEESGANILYLALGFLTWFEDDNSQTAREAPLVLLPVELVRNLKTSTYDLKLRDEDTVTNLPLQQRLRDDYGIPLPDIAIDEGWRPSTYFADIEALALRPRWRVTRDAAQLGFFSFSKLLMYLDLDIATWPEDALADHPLTKALLYEGFASNAPMFGPNDRLDPVLGPEQLFHVVDADASQAKVVEEVRSGRNLVVQGPPGTGKSQTITNIIATAVKEGKTVLFVAEKMAALSVVHSRLVKAGLRDVCLELHSKAVSKKVVLEELLHTLVRSTESHPAPAGPTAVRECRDRLNTIADQLHHPIGQTGETPFSVLGLQSRFMAAKCAVPSLVCDALSTMSRGTEAELARAISEYADALRDEGSTSRNPFEGVRYLGLDPVEIERLVPYLKGICEPLEKLLETLVRPLEALLPGQAPTLELLASFEDCLSRLEHLPEAPLPLAAAILEIQDLSRLQGALEAGLTWKALRDQSAETFTEAAFETSLDGLRGALAVGSKSMLARWGPAYRNASTKLAGFLRKDLPKTAHSRIALVDELSAVAVARKAWEADDTFCKASLGEGWRSDRTDFALVLSVFQWCRRLKAAPLKLSTDMALKLAGRPNDLARIRASISEKAPAARDAIGAVEQRLDLETGAVSGPKVDLRSTLSRLRLMAENTHRYRSWIQISRLRNKLRAAGLRDLEQRMKQGELDGAAAATELKYARAERLWRLALDQSPGLKGIGSEDRHALVSQFATLDRARFKDTVQEILATHLKQVPQGALDEMKILRGEIAKKKKHVPLRRLFRDAGNAVQRIKPVLLMSPISVAQFIPPSSLSFDLLVIDEASQVRPEDALGVVARAKQIVVVGDKKQLPPSAFFDRLLSDYEVDDESESSDLLGGAAPIADMESILTLCEARGLGSRMLNWHYRSRDPSLIAVSNREFYKSGLILPPSPFQADPAYGLKFNRVNGVYDRGGKRDNRIEADMVVASIAEHARKSSHLSLGVVTFSIAQRNLITELLERARRSDAELDAFLREGQAEDVFVKNIENVQGDERDVILISVCYGPTTPGGRLSSMSFGPVNTEGGDRRLNVLFTRARVRCEVFASFDPGDIDLTRALGDGPRILKHFLDFAKTGQLEEHAPTGLAADSPFEEDVAEVIRDFGLLADPQVGSVGFRIDIGVRHPERPGTYLLAVECDGATYHAALWARERDRLRQEVLQNLGWRFHRIWSTDWFYNRQAEIDRLREALTAARGAAVARTQAPEASAGHGDTANTDDEQDIGFELPEAVVRQMPAYRRASFKISGSQEPHEVSPRTLAGLVQRIVEVEGPITTEEVARRVASCFGKEKAGSRILDAAKLALALAKNADPDLHSEGSFWFTREQQLNPPVRDRSLEAGPTIKAANISMMEIAAAMDIARKDNAGGADGDLLRTAARLLGFARLGPDLHARLSSALS